MKATAALLRFVDDELFRAPLLAEQVAEATREALTKDLGSLAPGERAVAGELQRLLHLHRTSLVDGFVRELNAQVRQELAGMPSEHHAQPFGLEVLSLVDEDEVAADVEVSRAVEAIRNIAEQELREIAGYTSALIGDMAVAQNSNPFGPELMARTLWAAIESLPMPRAYRATLMRHACMPLAELARRTYAGACARLQAVGVQPAVHRTIVVHGTGGPRSFGRVDVPVDVMPGRPADGRPSRPTLEEVLQRIDEALRSLPLDGDRQRRDQLRHQQAAQLADAAQQPGERHLVDLISHLFDAMLADRRLAPDMHNVVLRLQPPALRVALRDAAMLDDHAHPVWLLMDRMALQGDLHPPGDNPERTRMLRYLYGLIDTLATEQPRDADAFRWAHERLHAYERRRFEQRRALAEPQFDALQDLEDKCVADEVAATTSHAALDVGTLDTVPADLLDHLQRPGASPATSAADWLAARRSGEWVRMFRQGGRVSAQILWYGERKEVWLFADGATRRTWTLRRRALERLYANRLLSLQLPRSLIRDAAAQVLRDMSAAKAA